MAVSASIDCRRLNSSRPSNLSELGLCGALSAAILHSLLALPSPQIMFLDCWGFLVTAGSVTYRSGSLKKTAFWKETRLG